MMDAKDYKILYELSGNARLPVSTLAKRVGLSREVVDYRIKQLVKNKIIVDFITEIDETRFGYSRHLVYLAFQKADAQKENEIIGFLVRHPFVSWTTTTTGKWSIVLDIIAKSPVHLNEIMDEIKDRYCSYIAEYHIASQVTFEHYHDKYYGLTKKDKLKAKQIIPCKIDPIDLRILSILSNNARIGYVELGRKLNLSYNGVKNRIKRLIDAGVIKSFFIQPDKTKLGFEQYYLLIEFMNQTTDAEKKTINYFRSHPSVNAFYKPAGLWGLDIAIFVRNVGELRKIIMNLRNMLGEVMRIKDTMLFYEEPKSNYLPPGVFQ